MLISSNPINFKPKPLIIQFRKTNNDVQILSAKLFQYMEAIFNEITPLAQYDSFLVFAREKKEFTFPLHYHKEYELNFILNGKDAQRIVGDHIENIDSIELVLVGPDLAHGWFTDKCTSEMITEVTIQFHRDLFDEKLLLRNPFRGIHDLLDRCKLGVCFSIETANTLKNRILTLKSKSGIESMFEFLGILSELSIAEDYKMLSSVSFSDEKNYYHDEKIVKANEYIHKNYQKEFSLADLAANVNMTEVSLSRLLKKRTGKTYVEILNEIRLSYACKQLIESNHSISEISFICGFNNISYFNKIFKKIKKTTPKEFRQNYMNNIKII